MFLPSARDLGNHTAVGVRHIAQICRDEVYAVLLAKALEDSPGFMVGSGE